MLDRTKPLIVAVSLTAIIAVVSGAEATVIFDNFDAGGGFHATDNSVAASANRSFGFVSATRAAAKFTVSGGDISLDSVTLPISEQSSVSGDFLRVRLAADAGGAPGATVEVLSENASIWPPTSNPFTTKTTLLSTTHPLLSDGASYWIVTELTSFPAGDPISVDYRWFMNKSGSMVPARQQQQNGGGLPSDPWTGFSGSLALAFRLAGTRGATTYTWNVASGSWAAAGNWAPPRTTPATNDILVFDGTVTPSATVTDMPNDETIAQLRVQGSAQVTLNAAAPDTLSIQGDVGDDL